MSVHFWYGKTLCPCTFKNYLEHCYVSSAQVSVWFFDQYIKFVGKIWVTVHALQRSRNLKSKVSSVYRMAGNFRGVLIFAIFLVDLAVTKIFHPWKLMPTVIINMVMSESMMMGVVTNIVAAQPTTVATVIQLIASSTLLFFYLMLFVQVSVGLA